MYISTKEELNAFIERASNCDVLAIDTEFLREKTYFPKPCLIQFATKDEIALVDPFKVGKLTVLAPLLENPNITKLFHSGLQDIEILYNETGVVPSPIFDTQLAAALLGHPKQVGYATLVKSICGVSLKKADSFTDWSIRPLSESQLEYAADDVVYLLQMYEPIVNALTEANRLSWLDGEFKDMEDPKRYKADPRTRFLHLKRNAQLNRRQLSAAREVSAWREERAIKYDIPRKWVLTDEQIVEACKRESRTIDDLYMIRGVREKLPTKDARELVALLIKGLDAPESTWPRLPHSDRNERNVDVEVELMNALLRLRAKENGVAPQVIASSSDLTELARGYYEESELLKGWKKKIVGDELVCLLEGKLALSLDNGVLVVSDK